MTGPVRGGGLTIKAKPLIIDRDLASKGFGLDAMVKKEETDPDPEISALLTKSVAGPDAFARRKVVLRAVDRVNAKKATAVETAVAVVLFTGTNGPSTSCRISELVERAIQDVAKITDVTIVAIVTSHDTYRDCFSFSINS